MGQRMTEVDNANRGASGNRRCYRNRAECGKNLRGEDYSANNSAISFSFHSRIPFLNSFSTPLRSSLLSPGDLETYCLIFSAEIDRLLPLQSFLVKTCPSIERAAVPGASAIQA